MNTLLEHMTMTEGAAYLIAITFAVGFVGFWRFLTGREKLATAPARSASLLSETVQGFALPPNVFRHAGHGWAALEGNGLVRIGVDDFLPRAIGRVDAIELPHAGDTVVAGQPAFTLIQGQRRAEIAAPVSGVVTEINPALSDGPASVKEHPFGTGWVARVRPTALAEDLTGLHVAERASAWLKREAIRLREFVLAQIADRPDAVGFTMADGGVPSNGPLEMLDDDAWRAFLDAQTPDLQR